MPHGACFSGTNHPTFHLGHAVSESHRHEPISLFASARCWLHFHNLEVRHRLRRSRISARRCGLVSAESDGLSNIGIKVNRHAINNVRDSTFIHESILVRLACVGQATGDCAVSFWFWGLTESKSWRNHQNREN